MQDLNGMNMETEFDYDWGSAQAQDESIMLREAQEAIEHLNDVVRAIEQTYGVEMLTTRAHIRVLERIIGSR